VWGERELSFEAAAILLAWVAIAVLGFAMAGLVRQMHVLLTNQNRVSAPRPGPRVGSKALSSDWLLGSGPSVLLFVDANCAVCEQVLPEVLQELPRWQRDRILLLYRGEASDALALFSGFTHEEEAFDYYRVSITPFAVAIRDGLVVDSGPVGSANLLYRFIVSATEEGIDVPTS